MDLCMNCGAVLPSKLWGAECICQNSDTVHLVNCSYCGKSLGIIVDDDYCGPDKIACTSCITAPKPVKTKENI